MSSEFFKICDDYGVPNDPMRYRDEKFYCTYQHGVHWPDDLIGPGLSDSCCVVTRWVPEDQSQLHLNPRQPTSHLHPQWPTSCLLPWWSVSFKSMVVSFYGGQLLI